MESVMNMDIQEVKGTDRIFRTKIESLEKRCRQLEGIIKNYQMNGPNAETVKQLSMNLI